VLTEEDWAAIKAEVARTIDSRLSETDLQRIRAIDQIHHPTEEVIRERLRLAGQNQPYLDVLTRQHEVLNEMTRNFRQAVEGVVNGEVQRRDQVEALGREMIATLRAHLDLEEREAFPLARQVLTEEDWAAIQAEVARTIDSRLSETDLQRIRAIVQHLTSQVRV
jgi:hemerythrin-like domain-containing protein